MSDLIKLIELVDAIRTLSFLMLIGFVIAAGMRLGQWVIPQPDQQMQLLVCVSDGSELVGNCKYLEDFEVAN